MLNQNHSKNPFQDRVRVRVCGILQENGKILLLKHNSIGPAGYLWSPPGGGVEFGEHITETLKKEFAEETNLHVEVGEYLFTNEYIGGNHHAIELFFEVKRPSGNLKLGSDPELSAEKQILTEVRFFSAEDLASLPENAIHNAFNAAGARDKITELRGLITFKH
ncbi:NUDIX domain-containing protein [Ekhidna sp.]|uniref:NUDIX domain-containing protein n=1 Tax=Ekhidna sp. TaxID=2608089 RepID=UPI0035120B3A